MENSKTIEYLNSKAWYRLIKVLYVFCYVLAVILVSSFSLMFVPAKEIDLSSSLIVCNNGTEYKALDNGIYNVDRLGSGGAYDEKATTLCKQKRYLITLKDGRKFVVATEGEPSENDLVEIAATQQKEPDNGIIKTVPEKSNASGDYGYTVKLNYSITGNWKLFISGVAAALFLVVIVFEIIRRTFFYVVIGTSFWKRPKLFK